MDVQLQAKLLRAIQESEIDRLGGKDPVAVDVRIIATTNSDLKKDIEEKKFRGDLYYRLNVIPARIPPLREREDDIPTLVDHFLTKYARINRKKKPQLGGEIVRILKNYPWPGNVRELENVIERAVLICGEGAILPEHLFLECDEERSAGDGPAVFAPDVTSIETPMHGSVRGNPTLREVEKNLICETLKEVNGNRTKASKILGISVRTT